MNFSLFIQARMNSTRLPGKSLLLLRERPSLLHLVDSLRQCSPAGEITVLTSSNPADEGIESICCANGISCFRGSEENVASRFAAMARHEYFVRVSGDSPLLDYRIVEEVLSHAGNADLITTTGGKRYPSGMNVELVRTKAFLDHYPAFSQPRHFEHVTDYLYEAGLSVLSLDCPIADPDRYKFSLDTREDETRLARFFSELGRPHYTYPFRTKCEIYADLFL